MDPLILDLTGVALEIRLWRGANNPFLVTILKADGSALSLANYDVTMTVVDRPGGTVKFNQTNSPGGGHANETAGQTRFVINDTVTSGLTGQRTYTWKYQIVVRDRTTNAKYPAFHGDARVLAPPSPV